MKDLKEIKRRINIIYEDQGLEISSLQELVLGYKWLMSIDKEDRISLALRIGKEDREDIYLEFMRRLIGQDLDQAVEACIEAGGNYRNLAISLLNLMSKPLNSKEMLLKRKIEKTPGLNFNLDLEGKKVGLVGYGVYPELILGKASEFHVFDLRKERSVISRSIKNTLDSYPKGIKWHLGKNALEYSKELAELDVIIMSGSSLVNNTYLDILECCKNASIKGIYGPSNELLPDYLFDLGYKYIFSTSIRNKSEYLAASLDLLPNFREFDYMDIYELRKLD